METHVDATAAMSRRPQEIPCSGRPSMLSPVRWVAGNGHLRCADDGRAEPTRHPENRTVMGGVGTYQLEHTACMGVQENGGWAGGHG